VEGILREQNIIWSGIMRDRNWRDMFKIRQVFVGVYTGETREHKLNYGESQTV
jgi:hypothetical protein